MMLKFLIIFYRLAGLWIVFIYLFVESHKWRNMRTGVQRKLLPDFYIIFLCFDFRFKFNVFVFINYQGFGA